MTASAPTWATVSRALRRSLGMAQEDWAAALEVSRKTVQRWERGDAAPSAAVEARLLALCADEDVFGRAARGAVDLGVTDVEAVRDLVARARGGSAPNPSPVESGVVGRELDGSRLQRLRAEHRLVTLVGPGGVGKTTLAMQAMADDDLVVRLDEVTDPDLVLAALADALGPAARRSPSLREGVIRALQARRGCLVLDNFEHLLAAAAVVADLVASCPDLHVLVTSRAALRLAEEVVMDLAPLDCDGPNAPAVQLLLARTGRVDPTADRDAEDHDTDDDALAAEVCRRLDGLPLAIELAAARRRHLSLADLADRLDRSVEILSVAPRDGVGRHRSLRDAVGWSVDLLADAERRLLERLSPFVGGASLDAVEAVGDPPVLDALGALIDHHLVQREGSRYRLLETVRQYAGELAAPEAPSVVAEPFVGWCLAYARAQPDRFRGPAVADALREVAVEYPNLRAALVHLTSARDPRALDLALALCPYWDGRSLVHDARHFLEPALGAPGADPLRAASARIWIGYFAAHQGELELARRMAEQAQAVFDEAGILTGTGYAHMVLGYVAAEAGDPARARARWEASAMDLEAAGDDWGRVRPINNLAELARSEGDLDEAARRHLEALALCRALGDRGTLPAVLCGLGQVQLDAGDVDAGRTSAVEALVVARDLVNRIGEVNALELLARADFESGAVEPAVAGWGEAQRLRDDLGLAVEARDRARRDHQLAAARAALGPVRFAARWAPDAPDDQPRS